MKNILIRLLSLFSGLILIFIILPHLGVTIFSSYKEIISISANDIENIGESMVYTFYRFITSILIGYIIGVLISIPCLLSEKVDSFLSIWYTILRITPTIVWIPILFSLPKEVLNKDFIPIILGIIFSSLYVSMHIIKVVKDISDEEKIAMKSMKVDFMWKWKYCYYPRIVVSSVSSLKFGGSIAFILVIVGESLISVDRSLGFLLSSYQTYITISKPQFWLVTIIISLLALIIFYMFSFLNKLTRTND